MDGYGPENINLEAPQHGVYKILVHYWDDHDGDDPAAEISILNFGQEVASFGPRQLNQIDDVWEVAEVEIPSL